jgi:hypothetical protein
VVNGNGHCFNECKGGGVNKKYISILISILLLDWTWKC